MNTLCGKPIAIDRLLNGLALVERFTQHLLELGMEPFALVAITLIGLLVIIQVLSPRRAVKWILLILLTFVFGPTILAISKGKTAQYLSQSHAWWEYVVGVLIFLIIVRLLLDFIFPWRRR